MEYGELGVMEQNVEYGEGRKHSLVTFVFFLFQFSVLHSVTVILDAVPSSWMYDDDIHDRALCAGTMLPKVGC